MLSVETAIRKLKKAFLYLYYDFNFIYRNKVVKDLKNDSKKDTLLLTHFGGGTQKFDEENYSTQGIIQVAPWKKSMCALSFYSDKGDSNRVVYIKQTDLERLLDKRYREVVIGSLFGYDKVHTLIKCIIDTKKKNGYLLTCLIHDYHSICPSIFLVKDGYYCKLECDHCYLNKSDEVYIHRRIWKELIRAADSLICFSNSSKEIMTTIYEVEEEKVLVQPHKVKPLVNKIVEPPRTQLHIGIVGNIYNEAKGLNLLRNIIPSLEKSIKISFVGNTEKEIGINQENIHYCGRYKQESISDIIIEEGINLFIFPSVCPETFSYVLSEIMQFNLPIIAFNVGAQKEKMEMYSKGILVDTAQEMINAIQNINENK